MRKWEDIVKDKLGGYESNLPEDSLAAFEAFPARLGDRPRPRGWARRRPAPQKADGSGERHPNHSAARGNV